MELGRRMGSYETCQWVKRVWQTMHLDLEATIQAAGVLLGRVPTKRMSYMRLLKLLYLADRRMLERAGRPITFDRTVAMRNGPVLSETYNIVKGEHIASSRWTDFIAVEGYKAILVEKPGNGQLSRLAVSVLKEVQDKVAHLDDWALVDHLHDTLPEWQQNEPTDNSSNPIALHDILSALGIQGEEAEEIKRTFDGERAPLQS